jgi:hypothetical protein
MKEWQRYESHKIVQAAPIFDVLDSGGEIAILVKPYGDDTVERFYPTEPAMAARADIGGYAVIYEDGYRSVSPQSAFESGYTKVEQ